MMAVAQFDHARAIGPDVGPWPGDQDQPLYWLARKRFVLGAPLASMSCLIVADRHYEVYVNGRLAVRQRNFFSGDSYLHAQEWGEEIRRFLVAGENSIDVVVRSDPWRNKNYRCCQPVLMLEADLSGDGEPVRIQTDETWQVGIIEGWRKQIAIGANGTIHFEKVTIPQDKASILSGFADTLTLTAPKMIDVSSLPPVYLWNDPPKRVDRHLPCDVVARGTYDLPEEVLVFDVCSSEDPTPNGNWELHASFDDAGGNQLDIAMSSLVPYEVELNGELVCKNTDVPGKHQMSLADFIAPAGQAVTRAGQNRIRIVVSEAPQGSRPLRFSIAGRPDLMDPGRWTYPDGRPAVAVPKPLELSEQIGAKFATCSADAICTSLQPFSIRAGDGRCPGFALLDFGEVMTGRVTLRIQAESGGRIHLAYGFGHSAMAVDCHRMWLRAVDTLEVPAGESMYGAFDVRTFRYLDLLFEGFSGAVTVSDIHAEEAVFLDDGGSSFNTPDSRLNDIWLASRRTAQLCGNELYMDNPEREHAQWADATFGVASAGYYAFAEQRKVAKILEEIMLHQGPDGQLPGYAPGRWFPRVPLQCHMALFCRLAHRHFMHTGDESLARRTFEAMLKIFRHWQRYTDGHGLIRDLHTVFVDWGSHIYSYGRGSKGSTGALTSMNAYYLGALRAGGAMAGWLGRDADVRELTSRADAVSAAIRGQMYDAQIGLFRDGAGDPQAEQNVSQTANALAVLFGAAPEGEEKAIMTQAFEREGSADIIPANAFFVEQAGSALFEAGCGELALDWIRAGFGRMLDEGPGTLWETWQPHASLCQCTGAGVAWLFSRYLAGVYPAEPGYRRIGIDPHPCGLDYLEATLETPSGRVGLDWHVENDRMSYRLSLPAEAFPTPSSDLVSLSNDAIAIEMERNEREQ